MKAVILQQPEQLIYADLPTPEPQRHEVRVRVQAASICGSDMLRVYRGAARVLPIVLGHEFSGVVDAVGSEVGGDWLGKSVTVAPLIPCMTCESCQRGLYSTCPRYSFIGSRVNGGFADYVIAPASNLVALPDGIDMTLGALIEPITVTMHALDKAGDVRGKTVAITGAGSIGLLAIQAALWKGASMVIASDVSESSLEAARMLGAHHTINARAESVPERFKALAGRGADIALEVSGAPTALHDAIHLCGAGGHIVCVGNQPLDATLSLSLVEHMMRQELHLHGAWMSYSAPFPGQEWHDAAALVAANADVLRTMFTHHVALEGLPGMFERLHRESFPRRKVLIEYV